MIEEADTRDVKQPSKVKSFPSNEQACVGEVAQINAGVLGTECWETRYDSILGANRGVRQTLLVALQTMSVLHYITQPTELLGMLGKCYCAN